MEKGLVIKSTGSWYLVRTNGNRLIECKIKGNFRLKGIRSTNPVVVGDRVSLIINNEGTAFITKIDERKNYIIRKSPNLSKESHIIAANIDICFLIVTIKNPEISTVFIDRFLVSAEAYGIPVKLIFNKTDIYNEEDTEYMDALIDLYEYIGYSCHKASTITQEGMEFLRASINGNITLFSGNSGVGKSSLINILAPKAKLRTGEISEYHSKGMHTTTFSEMIELPTGGFIIDTPGIKGFGLIDMKTEEIYHYFPEIFEYSKDCKFHNCIHLNEPGCAVRDAVSNHFISESRYKSYLNMLEEDLEQKYRK